MRFRIPGSRAFARLPELPTGQFWMVVLALLFLAAYPAYRYYALPGQQAREWADAEESTKLTATNDSLTLVSLIESGASRYTVDSVQNAQLRASGAAIFASLNMLNRHLAQRDWRPVFLVVSLILVAFAIALVWKWFGKRPIPRAQ